MRAPVSVRRGGHSRHERGLGGSAALGPGRVRHSQSRDGNSSPGFHRWVQPLTAARVCKVSHQKNNLWRFETFRSSTSSVKVQKKRQFQLKYEKKMGLKENVEGSNIHELTEVLATDIHFSCIFPCCYFIPLATYKSARYYLLIILQCKHFLVLDCF